MHIMACAVQSSLDHSESCLNYRIQPYLDVPISKFSLSFLNPSIMLSVFYFNCLESMLPVLYMPPSPPFSSHNITPHEPFSHIKTNMSQVRTIQKQESAKYMRKNPCTSPTPSLYFLIPLTCSIRKSVWSGLGSGPDCRYLQAFK